MFIPTIEESHDTSYFMSRFIWNPEDDQVNGGSDFDDMTETCSTASYTYSNVHSEDVKKRKKERYNIIANASLSHSLSCVCVS